MKRVEIVANRSVQEDLMDALAAANVARSHTLIPVAHGMGRQGRRTGEAVWPEENFVLIIYCEEVEALTIAEVVARIKKSFPREGVKLFELG
ncbi:MAG TPA: hypothetical protein VLH39_02470 [Magnetospirillaceae bacterium]|nr:hypothetical protein [Magnetospirillaceae bacterium]